VRVLLKQEDELLEVVSTCWGPDGTGDGQPTLMSSSSPSSKEVPLLLVAQDGEDRGLVVLQGLEDDLVLVLCTTSEPSIIKLLHMWVCY
jgi:hypothetical protein